MACAAAGHDQGRNTHHRTKHVKRVYLGIKSKTKSHTASSMASASAMVTTSAPTATTTTATDDCCCCCCCCCCWHGQGLSQGQQQQPGSRAAKAVASSATTVAGATAASDGSSETQSSGRDGGKVTPATSLGQRAPLHRGHPALWLRAAAAMRKWCNCEGGANEQK